MRHASVVKVRRGSRHDRAGSVCGGTGAGTTCTAGNVPVYRLFRGGARFPDVPNHRFTTSKGIYDQFVAAGWDGEGVSFCVPAS